MIFLWDFLQDFGGVEQAKLKHALWMSPSFFRKEKVCQIHGSLIKIAEWLEAQTQRRLSLFAGCSI